jgi:acid phosphatase
MAIVIGASCAGHRASTPTPPRPQSSAPASHENLNAVLWVQTASEYEAGAVQAYRLAAMQIDAALADRSWTAAIEQQGDPSKLPPAVIVDIDETVLDNSYYQARLVRDNATYATDTWDRWVKEERATAVPGAREFTDYAAKKGVTVFYVTNRTANLEESTRKNLAAAGFPLAATIDTVLVRGERPEWSSSSKGPRRAFIAASFRILLLVGDDLADFVVDASGTPDERRQKTEPYANWWGRRWIMLSNPTYGSWERAIVGAEKDALGAKRRALQYADR